MKKFINSVTAVWMLIVFMFLQYWFWLSIANDAGDVAVRLFVAGGVFVFVGVMPFILTQWVSRVLK